MDWACTSGDVALADALVRPIAPEVNLRRRAEISDWAERILELTPRDGEAEVVFWVLWATDRHVQAGDRQAYERVVARYGHADHPVVRYTHAYLYDDGEEGYASSRAAVAWLRERGEDHEAARFFTESAGIDVPAGTFLVNRTVEARTVFDQGQQSRGLRMLREHVDDLLDTDYVDVARMVAMEFVYMAAALDHLATAAHVLT